MNRFFEYAGMTKTKTDMITQNINKNMTKSREIFSKVESAFKDESIVKNTESLIPYIIVDNFPKLGLLASLRFIEWASENPEGVISLPTGKTPEYFIKWTQTILENWDTKKVETLRNQYGLGGIKKPDLKGLQFVQIDEWTRRPA